eukprot:7383219-Prymnesium_polylepis.1
MSILCSRGMDMFASRLYEKYTWYPFRVCTRGASVMPGNRAASCSYARRSSKSTTVMPERSPVITWNA